MKKLTKLTALALALALMLGMTAMAGTPSEIVMTDDFSDAADLSWDTFGATRSKMSVPIYFPSNAQNLKNFTPVEGYNKYYYNNGANLVNVNGKIAIQDSGAKAPEMGTTLVYTLPDAWTLEDSNDSSYVIVAQLGWTVEDIKTNVSKYGHIGFAGPIYDTVSQDGTTTNTNVIKSSLGYLTNVDAGSFGIGIGQMSGHSATSISGTLKEGEDAVIRMVSRHTWRSNTTASENEIITDATKDSLNLITYVGRKMYYTGTPVFRPKTTDPKITAIDGFWFRSPDASKNTFSDFIVYKLSMDRNDFVYDTANMTTTNIAPDGNMEVVFSQPISTTTICHSSSGNMVDIYPLISVKTGEGDDQVALTYGEDYTIEVSERIVGTAIKGVLAIKPLKDWDFGTTYTVTLPNNMTNAGRVSMLTENNVPMTFTTVAAPTLALTLNAYKGLASSGTALEALEAGTTYFAVSAIQSDGYAVTNGTVRIEILDADGNVVKYATAKKALSTTTAATYGAAFKLEAGQTAKAYVVGTNGEATID